MPDDDIAALLQQLVERSRPPNADEPLTIKDFCKLEKISVTTFYRWQAAGIAPDIDRFVGFKLLRISPKLTRRG